MRVGVFLPVQDGLGRLDFSRCCESWVSMGCCKGLADKEAVAIYLLSLVRSGWLSCLDVSAHDELKCEEIGGSCD